MYQPVLIICAVLMTHALISALKTMSPTQKTPGFGIKSLTQP